jgi:hypothetical protein
VSRARLGQPCDSSAPKAPQNVLNRPSGAEKPRVEDRPARVDHRGARVADSRSPVDESRARVSSIPGYGSIPAMGSGSVPLSRVDDCPVRGGTAGHRSGTPGLRVGDSRVPGSQCPCRDRRSTRTRLPFPRTDRSPRFARRHCRGAGPPLLKPGLDEGHRAAGRREYGSHALTPGGVP